MLIPDMPYQTKLEVYDRLNCREWPAVLGKPPEGFETMNVEQKLAEVEPIMQQIEMEIGKKAVLRYHQKHNLGRTDQQFEDWWDSLGKHKRRKRKANRESKARKVFRESKALRAQLAQTR